MRLDKQEKVEVENLLKIIRRAKFDGFQGQEALALSRAYHWLDDLLHQQDTPVPAVVTQSESAPIEIIEPVVPEPAHTKKVVRKAKTNG